MPDFEVTSRKEGSGFGFATWCSQRAAAHPAIPSTKDRRSIINWKWPLVFPRRHRSPLAQLRVFFCQYCVSQSSVDLLEQHIKLKINDDPPRITNIGRPLRIFSGLLIVLESQVELCTFVPRGSKIRS